MRLLLLTLGCLIACATAGDIEDLLKMDTEPLLKDEAKWKVLFECLMDRGPCGQYQIIRDTLPKLIGNKCEKCSPEQKEMFEKRIKVFLDKYPQDYALLVNKYLPKPDE